MSQLYSILVTALATQLNLVRFARGVIFITIFAGPARARLSIGDDTDVLGGGLERAGLRSREVTLRLSLPWAIRIAFCLTAF